MNKGDNMTRSILVEESAQEKPACGHCGLDNREDGADACLGAIPGVVAACCGHGEDKMAYMMFENGHVIRGYTSEKEKASEYSVDFCIANYGIPGTISKRAIDDMFDNMASGKSKKWKDELGRLAEGEETCKMKIEKS